MTCNKESTKYKFCELSAIVILDDYTSAYLNYSSKYLNQCKLKVHMDDILIINNLAVTFTTLIVAPEVPADQTDCMGMQEHGTSQ